MTHATQQTSLWAYQEIQATLAPRQQQVYEALKRSEGMTNGELSSFLNVPINSITPRIFELREKGLVREKEKRICKSSGFRAITWEVAPT